jgi:hypothetical protein
MRSAQPNVAYPHSLPPPPSHAPPRVANRFTVSKHLYICRHCLKYMRKRKTLAAHKSKCTASHPPGDKIYDDDRVSVWEVDGRRQPMYTQSLCLLSKLFLDHKTLYYDTDPFFFYVVCEHSEDPEEHNQIVGYFSKERDSPEQCVRPVLVVFWSLRTGGGSVCCVLYVE